MKDIAKAWKKASVANLVAKGVSGETKLPPEDRFGDLDDTN